MPFGVGMMLADQAAEGVIDAGGRHTLFIVDGHMGQAQAGPGGPVAVAGVHGRVVVVAGRDDAGDPQQRVVVVAGRRDAATRGGLGQGAVGV